LNAQYISGGHNSHDDLLLVEDSVMQQPQEGTATITQCMLKCGPMNCDALLWAIIYTKCSRKLVFSLLEIQLWAYSIV
jgi:hypothetical protein